MSSINLTNATKEIKEWQSIEVGAVFEIGRILSEVKASDVKHGDWTAWLESVGYNPRTAQRYMQIHARFYDVEGARELSVSKLAELLSIPVDTDADTMKQFVSKAASLSARKLRDEIRATYKPEQAAARNTEEEDEQNAKKDARIRMLERQVRELAQERDQHKQEAERYKDRAEEAEARMWSYMSRSGGITAHELLGLSQGASPQEIKKRFRELSHILHPDKQGDAGLFDIVKKAYDSIYVRSKSA